MSYRLGDLLHNNLHYTERLRLYKENPNSIGGRYIRHVGGVAKSRMINFTALLIVVHETCNKSCIPQNQTTSIHLRVGDVVCGSHWHEINKRPLEVKRIDL